MMAQDERRIGGTEVKLSYRFQRTRVKICGFTRAEDARKAAILGVDAVGLVFHAESPRHVKIGQAQAITAALPPFVSVVALFADAGSERIREVLAAVQVDLIQFHGDESPDFCRAFGRPFIKAVRMREDAEVAALAERYAAAGASGLLLDAYHPGVKGGTGSGFDWSRIPRQCALPIVLAGGLTPENAAEAVRQVRPYALDVSSGVESAKGIKDAAKMAAFIKEVYDCECTNE